MNFQDVSQNLLEARASIVGEDTGDIRYCDNRDFELGEIYTHFRSLVQREEITPDPFEFINQFFTKH